MEADSKSRRREFLRKTGLLAGSFAAGSIFHAGGFASPGGLQDKEENVSPAEDLMREHGILKRVLLVYGEIEQRILNRTEFPPEALYGGAQIIRDFIENYHEKLEEDFLFPRFEKAHTLTDLVVILRTQHERGRILTQRILKNANQHDLRRPEVRNETLDNLQQFVRMYNPHEAREDTVLFPAFSTIVSTNEYDSLGEEFEDQEHKFFGEDGFEKYVDKVAGLEKILGINDLRLFTPKIGGMK